VKEADWKKVKRDKKALAERSSTQTFGQKLRALDRLHERTKSMREGTPSGKDTRRVANAATTRQGKR
jgi:hypothetical protein